MEWWAGLGVGLAAGFALGSGNSFMRGLWSRVGSRVGDRLEEWLWPSPPQPELVSPTWVPDGYSDAKLRWTGFENVPHDLQTRKMFHYPGPNGGAVYRRSPDRHFRTQWLLVEIGPDAPMPESPVEIPQGWREE